MWLLLHDDLANPEDVDPILRESTRLSAAVTLDAQTSIQPETLQEWLGPGASMHPMIFRAIGLTSTSSTVAPSARAKRLYEEYSPITHVDASDPPLMLLYSRSSALPPSDPDHAIHHPEFGRRIKERSDNVGHECILKTGLSLSEESAGGRNFLIEKLVISPTVRRPRVR
jgi:hypothetical protein